MRIDPDFKNQMLTSKGEELRLRCSRCVVQLAGSSAAKARYGSVRVQELVLSFGSFCYSGPRDAREQSTYVQLRQKLWSPFSVYLCYVGFFLVYFGGLLR
jgi:hypothetical protein